ncbi:MAG: alpha/beta hydrolase, partial [Herbiconiux sp.]|nr:alpha/beta hydrolase [Herbiconiux sp.]
MSERMIEVRGVEICAESYGDPADPTILLVHGAQASMLWWPEPLCERIAAGARHVIRFDTRDTGRSSTFPVGAPGYAMSDLADDAAGVLDGFGAQQAHVVGRSMGGGIALFLALDHPARVL